MKLTAKNVHDVFMNCLFKEDESTENHKVGNGVMTKVSFHPQRLSEKESDIIEMLNDLPDEFKKTGGGGWSFLNMCIDKNGNQWGEHSNIDELIILGNTIGKVSFQLPREMWSILPGGMPYVVIND